MRSDAVGRSAPADGSASAYSNSRNCSTVSPASRTRPPIVNALTGLWRGMVSIRCPFVITMCLLWRAIQNPAFSKTRTASR